MAANTRRGDIQRFERKLRLALVLFEREGVDNQREGGGTYAEDGEGERQLDDVRGAKEGVVEDREYGGGEDEEGGHAAEDKATAGGGEEGYVYC